MTRVAIVEDENLTRRAIAIALRDQGFDVHEAADAYACRSLLRDHRIDVLLLDLGLPGLDGLEFAAQLRDRGEMGLIVVTRQSAHEARIRALDVGADDYLVKPVHYGELGARIRSVLRRCRPNPGRRKRLGRWVIDLEARSAIAGTENANLTRGEFEILSRLIEAGTKIVSREDLLAAMSRNPLESDLRSVDALVSRIRRKLDAGPEGHALIVTAPGFGYRLDRPAEDI
jgi:DNA-binding response OmpR family regulator